MRTSGQATLYLALLIGGVTIITAVTLAFIVSSFATVTGNYQAANRANALASGGAMDGFLQLVRDKDFTNASGYQFPLNASPSDATVTVENPWSAGKARITSTASVSGVTRKLEAFAAIHPVSGEISLLAWRTVPF